MTPRPPPQPAISDDRVLDEASRWFVKSQAGLSSWERASLLAWLKAAPTRRRHRTLVEDGRLTVFH